MSYNGSGTFVINSTGQPVVTGTVISSTAFNALTADLATGLSTAITTDGQSATSVRIPFAAGIDSTLTTDATSIATGSIITAGGVGIAKALWVGGLANIAGVLTTIAQTITSASANAFAVGRVGTTNPAFNIDASTALSATGVNIKSAAAAGGVAVSVLSSGTNEALTVNAKGSGAIGIGSVSTGAVTITPATTISGAATLSSTLGVTGAATLSSTLGVTGATTLSSTLAVTGAVTLTTALPVASGGTGATTAAAALTALGGIGPAAMRSYLAGLGLTTAADVDHDFTFAVGVATDGTNTVLMTLSSALTKQFDATFVEGTNAGGMVSGESLPTSGWVNFWLIQKANGAVDICGNNNATSGLSPTLPTGFIYKRRIGARLTDASANFLATKQNGDTVQYVTSIQDVDTATGNTTSRSLRTMSSPPGVQCLINFRAYVPEASDMITLFQDPNETDAAPNNTMTPPGGSIRNLTGYQGTFWFAIQTNTSSQIASRSSVASKGLDVVTYSFVDNRGRDD